MLGLVTYIYNPNTSEAKFSGTLGHTVRHFLKTKNKKYKVMVLVLENEIPFPYLEIYS